MAFGRLARNLLSTGAVAGLALGLIAVQAQGSVAEPAADAQQSIVVTVTPSTGLTDGEAVAVSGTGLVPETVYHVGQCVAVDPVTLACNGEELVDVTSDSEGNVDTTLTVRLTFDGVIGDEPWGPVDCSVDSCFVGLGDDNWNGGGAPVSFA
jgi:hypothetical protein